MYKLKKQIGHASKGLLFFMDDRGVELHDVDVYMPSYCKDDIDKFINLVGLDKDFFDYIGNEI